MAEMFIPTLHSFAMENIFTGSVGTFRFRLVPNVIKAANSKEVDFSASTITAQFWHGPFCYEKSTMEGENTFPLTEEGRAEMMQWLKENC